MSTPAPKAVEIVEVGLRDGLQPIARFVETQRKIDLLRGQYGAGLRRMEVSSFVSAAAVPQMADAGEVLCAALKFQELDAHVLVPTARHAKRALDDGALHLAFVLSVSPWHNNANVRRTPLESIEEFEKIVELAPRQTRFRVNVATAFDCPRLGRIAQDDVLQLLSAICGISPEAEITLCDTTGRATPGQVGELFVAAHGQRGSAGRWAFHGHDTYGMGAANAMAAWHAGVSVIDAYASFNRFRLNVDLLFRPCSPRSSYTGSPLRRRCRLDIFRGAVPSSPRRQQHQNFASAGGQLRESGE